MALYGSKRDISFFHRINREIIHNIIEQEVGYYQISLEETPTNVYKEAEGGKVFLPPVLIKCLIDRGDYEPNYSRNIPNINRNFSFGFLRKDLVEISLVPQIGDIILLDNDYFEVNLVNENQPIVGKISEYNYGEEHRDNFGTSFSIILEAHYVSPERLGINK